MGTAARKAFLLAGALLIGSGANAQAIDGPGVFVYLDTTAREITLEGMERRLQALSSGEADKAALRAIDRRTREEIEALYRQWGVSPEKHAAYGTRHAEAIEEWLAEHPEWDRSYDDLERRFQSLSNQLNSAR